MTETQTKKILAFVDDFFFIPQIESKVSSQYKITFIEHDIDTAVFDLGLLIDSEKPNLILIDMNHRSLVWSDAITTIKAQPKYGSIPILLFGSHTNVVAFKLAKEIGTDMVVGKSRFVQSMGELINKLVGNIQ